MDQSLLSSTPAPTYGGAVSSSSSSSSSDGTATPPVDPLDFKVSIKNRDFPLSPSSSTLTPSLPVSVFPVSSSLRMPNYIFSSLSNVTLPSRLRVLGNHAFSVLACVNPQQFGNSVAGFAPSLTKCSESKKQQPKRQLYLLPWTFSRAMARTWIFLLILVCALAGYLFVTLIGEVDSAGLGTIWMVGTGTALVVSLCLATFRRSRDGVLIFCRSLGRPHIEEYMFSYSWKHKAEDIRTLARGMHEAGVGVWIDVIKLTPGDEIGPVLRTVVSLVFRVVVFISPAYCSSINCCIELAEAVRHPQKCIFCIVKPLQDNVRQYLETLKEKGAIICETISELIPHLDRELQDTENVDAYNWWKRQTISGAGLPSHVSPSKWTHIPRFSLRAPRFNIKRGLAVGPLYLTGDCDEAGVRFSISILLVLATFALIFNWGQIFYLYHSTAPGPIIDYVFLSIIAMCNVAPFLSFGALVDTRFMIHPSLRPLMASFALSGGVKVATHGNPSNAMLVQVSRFLDLIGHSTRGGGGVGAGGGEDDRVVHVHFIETIDERDRIFGPIANARAKAADSENCEIPGSVNVRGSLFVWNGNGDPFTKNDPIANEMMRYLVLVAGWEKTELANSLFSAIGIKVVGSLHSGSRAAARRARLKLRAITSLIIKQTREKVKSERKELLTRLKQLKTLPRQEWMQRNFNNTTMSHKQAERNEDDAMRERLSKAYQQDIKDGIVNEDVPTPAFPTR